MRYGSDAIIDWLVDLGIDHVALNPGATIRGLHESLVRDSRIRTVLALHEETAVGIAQGFWKATGRPMAVFLHDLVGIQHASMALFNASVDRAAMLVLGGSGPADERERRPWLDWIHYSIRHEVAIHEVVKATEAPASLLGVRDGLIRGLRTALSSPQGPVFLGIDTSIQENPVDDPALSGPTIAMAPAHLATADPADVDRVAGLLASATRPVVVVDRPVTGGAAALTAITELTGACVLDLGGGFSFPTGNWAYQTESRRQMLADADLVVIVEARDPNWALTEVDTGTRRSTRLTAADPVIVTIGCAALLNIPGVTVEQLLPAALPIVAEAGPFLTDLAINLRAHGAAADRERVEHLTTRHEAARAASQTQANATPDDSPVHPARLVAALGRAIGERKWLLANGIVQGWPARLLDIGPDHPFLGRSAGEGLGYGMPASLGAALAQHDDRIVVNLQSDGDLMYTASALWTAAHHRIPLLTVMYDNGTYGKDELHQRELATLRGRPQDTTHIAIRLEDPRIDFAALARAQGVYAIGPVEEPADLDAALQQAVRMVADEGKPVLVHVMCR